VVLTDSRRDAAGHDGLPACAQRFSRLDLPVDLLDEVVENLVPPPRLTRPVDHGNIIIYNGLDRSRERSEIWLASCL